jgi:D-glycero-D-manno-heptose 1,7-bisphosphate phosphatase
MGIDRVMPLGSGRTGQRAVFLDRDGILNDAIIRDGKPFPPYTVSELRLVVDAGDALVPLVGAGLMLIGVTNQPDVARGTQRREVVEAINTEILAALPLREIFVCFHDDSDKCACRKPKPGLLFQAAAKYQIDLRRSFLIGDRWKDIEAGYRAGCTTILVGHGYAQTELGQRPHFHAGSVSDAARWILQVIRNAVE